MPVDWVITKRRMRRNSCLRRHNSSQPKLGWQKPSCSSSSPAAKATAESSCSRRRGRMSAASATPVAKASCNVQKGGGFGCQRPHGRKPVNQLRHETRVRPGHQHDDHNEQGQMHVRVHRGYIGMLQAPRNSCDRLQPPGELSHPRDARLAACTHPVQRLSHT